MTDNLPESKMQNFLLVVLFVIIILFSAFHEGYFGLIAGIFWISLIAGFIIIGWLAMSISTKRLLSLLLGIFIIEYIKEAIGIRSNVWTYHGASGQFNFGVWAWVLGGMITYTLATKYVIRKLRKHSFSHPRWHNPAILIGLFFLMLLTMGKYWHGAGGLFFLFYISLLIIGVYASLKMDFAVFAGIVISSWIIGNPSEFLGSVPSNVWTFTYNPHYPPFFLLFGCWPLEILAQYALSAYLANEPLDHDTF